VTDLVSGATYASGCEINSGYLDDPTHQDYLGIRAKIPLGVDYAVELTNVRHHDSLSVQTVDYYCQLAYRSNIVSHINPTCYQVDPNWAEHELVNASLQDASGNALSSTTSPMIDGTTTDIVSFTLRSHAYGTVDLNYAGSPCNGSTSFSLELLAIEQP